MEWRELRPMFEGWELCLALIRRFNDHYAMDEEQQHYVFRYAMQVPAGGVALELGVCNGKTAAVLAYCAAMREFEAHGIDGFILENTADGINETMRKHDLPFTLHYGLTGNEPIPGRYLPIVPWDRPLDLLIVDGSHTDPWATDDIARWTPLVKPGCVALFHDYDGREDQTSAHLPVRRAVDRLTADWGMEYYVNGLMIKRKPI
jgi:hypothetical protein